ncbi:hypothetical protein R9X48_09310 [Lacticaseibacillus rhamnosus]
MSRRSNRRPDGAPSDVSALASRRHPIWPEIAEFGTARNCFSSSLHLGIRNLMSFMSMSRIMA